MTTEEAVAAAKAHHFDQAHELAQWLRDYRWAGEHGYVPPRNDDPLTWEGVLRYVYKDWLYRQHDRADRAIGKYGKLLACPLCGEKAGKTRTAKNCIDHEWDESGYDWCLQSARSLTRKGYYPGPVAEVVGKR